MVYHLPSSISVCKSVDQASSLMPVSTSLSSNHHQNLNKPRKIHPNSPPNPSSSSSSASCCHRSRSAAIDVVIFIAVVVALGFLILPSLKFLLSQSFQILGTIKDIFADEVSQAPLVYGSVGLSVCSAVLAAWGVIACTNRKCGNPNCKGLRKAAEFDIQLETEDCLKNNHSNHNNSNNNMLNSTERKGLFELPRDHHRELEAELKKMAPPNGRAVLVFRSRCGCSVGRLEVPGPKKHRKIKKLKPHDLLSGILWMQKFYVPFGLHARVLVLDGITMTTMHNVAKKARVVVRAVIGEWLLQSTNSRKLESDLEQVKGKNSSYFKARIRPSKMG